MIKTINGDRSGEYGKMFMKIQFNSDDDLPLNKQLKFHAMTIIIRSALKRKWKILFTNFLNECLYEL